MTATTLKTPVLWNAEADSRRLNIFRPWSEALAASMRLGDICKLRLGYGEFIWASVSVINGTIMTGTVTTPTIFAPQHGIYCQDVIQFAAENVIEVQTL